MTVRLIVANCYTSCTILYSKYVIIDAVQNDVLSLTLAESKAHCNHLTILLGKYESSVTAHQMTTSYADHALSAYQMLVGLLDTELALLTSKCQVLGVCGYGKLCTIYVVFVVILVSILIDICS